MIRVGAVGGVGESGEPEHRGEVADVRRTDVGERVLAVVGLVGQADAALVEVGHVALGIAAVGADVHAEDAADALAVERAERRDEARDVGDGVDLRELALERGGAERLDALLVHEAGVEVADLALLVVLGSLAGGLDDLADLGLGLVDQRHECAGGGTVGLDLRGAQPGAVDVAEQVVLDADLRVELSRVDAVGHASRLHSVSKTHPARLTVLRTESVAPSMRPRGLRWRRI